jgi:KTSC domain
VGLSRVKVFALALVFLTPISALAETSALTTSVCVKYGPCPLDVSSFTCTDTPRSSFVRRVCYDAPKSFMVIKLNETWYPYCEIDAATVQKLITAGSVGTFYNQTVRSRPDGTHSPFDCRDHPMPNYQ